MFSDLRSALRQLSHCPGFTTVIVLTLALGIGANTAIFSFFHGILLRPLPYHEADRVVALKQHVRELQPQLRSLQEVTTYTLDSATITGRGNPTLTTPAVVLPNFFSVLGANALLGRTFSASDPSLAHGRLATGSHDYWQAHLGGDPDILGQTLTANGVAFTVVGVMPPDFDFPREAQLWVTPAYNGHGLRDTPAAVRRRPARRSDVGCRAGGSGRDRHAGVPASRPPRHESRSAGRPARRVTPPRSFLRLLIFLFLP